MKQIGILSEAFILALPAICVILFTFNGVGLAVTNDGYGYLEIAAKMLGGVYWGNESLLDLANSASSVRTPLYPLIIAIAQGLWGTSLDSILKMHCLLAVVTMFGAASPLEICSSHGSR